MKTIHRSARHRTPQAQSLRGRSTRALVLAAGVAGMLTVSGCVQSGRSGDVPAPGGSGASSAACPFAPDTSVSTTARIAFQNIPNGDLVVKDQRLLETCMPNAKVSWSKFDSGGDVIQAFGTKSVDLGLIGSSPATKGLSAPLNIAMKVVWIHDVIGKAESLVAKDPAAKQITDLKGKKIAVAFSSTAHYSLLQALTDAGMDSAKDVTLINLAPDKMPSAWQGGQIDAAWVWDPTLTVLLKDGHLVTSSDETAKAGKPTYDLGAGTSAFIDGNAAFMTVWAKAQDAAVKMITNEPDKASVSISAVLSIPPADVKKQFEGYTYLDAAKQASPDWLGGKLAKDLQATATFLLNQGGITAISSPDVYATGVDAKPASSVK